MKVKWNQQNYLQVCFLQFIWNNRHVHEYISNEDLVYVGFDNENCFTEKGGLRIAMGIWLPLIVEFCYL